MSTSTPVQTACRRDAAARELIAASKALQWRNAVTITHGSEESRWDLLKKACAHLSAARNLLDPDQANNTVERLINLFTADDLMPRFGRVLALTLVAWDLKLYPAPNQKESTS